MDARKTYTFDGTTASLYFTQSRMAASCAVVFSDSELPGGRFEFIHADRRALSSAVAAAMPGYVRAGSLTPFMADHLSWLAYKVSVH